MEVEILMFAGLALFVLVFGLVSRRLEETPITPPISFVLFGLLIGPAFLGWITLDVEDEIIRLLAEFTLILVLFTDASRINLDSLRREHNLPVRMLAIGLPLTIIAGTLTALVLFNTLDIWEAALIGAILAPTDAALGQAVVSSPRVPVRIRQTLNVESGLNDGISLPVITVLIALAVAADDVGADTMGLALFTLAQVTLGPLVGIAVGYVGGKLVEYATKSSWMNGSFQRLASLALAFLAYFGAELVSGNGFIAAFCAGLTVGNVTRATCDCLYEFAEAEGQLLTLLIFTIFGAVMIVPALEATTWMTVLYALLSLTVIRLIPVALSLLGLRLQWATLLFLGWFGPRGLASILFGLLVLENEFITNSEAIFQIVVFTVLLSVFAHGLSAVPGANAYADYGESMHDEPDMPEMEPVSEMPVRLRHM